MPEFSPDGYREMLLGFESAGYSFCKFTDIDDFLNKEKSFVVLRHDIDIDLYSALELARIEHQEGIQSTYFLSLRSPFYNALSSHSIRIMLHIHQLGHDIAAHVDPTLYGGCYDNALSEIEVLEKYHPYINTQIASIHHPGNLNQLEQEMGTVERVLNCYEPILKKKMSYISDSTGMWRFGHPLESEAFRDRKPIHLLVHPIWWIQDGDTPIEKLRCLFSGNHMLNSEEVVDFLPNLLRSSRL